ncbi:MAG: DNA mismatch repair protein MutS [Pseudobdellovibrionaceae bacterium]
MKQYWDIKSLHQDKILLFRMGDFYEMFYEDAVNAAPILGIALTQRNKKSQDETPMCGMPHHSVAGPINKLLQQGFKVALCDQIEDPKTAKGIVKRAVTRILTPGMVYDTDTLDSTQAHYLMSMDERSISFADTSTGECFYFTSENISKTLEKIKFLPLAEAVLAPEDFAQTALRAGLESIFKGLLLSSHEVNPVALQDYVQLLSSLAADPSSIEDKTLPVSAQRLISYIHSLGGAEALKTLTPFQPRSFEQRLHLSATTLRHLEVFQNYKGESDGSLFATINKTQTSGGARLLRQWLSFPLQQTEKITERWAAIDSWRQHPVALKSFRKTLGQMGDLERRLVKISQPQANGRDLRSLTTSLQAALQALHDVAQQTNLPAAGTPVLFEKLHQLQNKIDRTLVEEPPLSTQQAYLIQKGFSAQLDELISLTTDSQALLQAMENREKEATGISSLKIRYNNVFGYYIEITHLHKNKVPAHYQRKQTLAAAERYCTDELLELERKVLAAQNQRAQLEFEIFTQLKKTTLDHSSQILQLAQICSQWDVLASLAWLSLENNYVRPQILALGAPLVLQGSRHPVVEKKLNGERFVANDIELSAAGCLLITGPNMAGKSTVMRQVALTVLLAQMGSFVPAAEAKLPLFDAVFTRIGASDQLSEGLSTFMVEMTETAEMLTTATSRSLLILDEVGRGTSTKDGLSLAQAILEYILLELKSYTLFATHYHELTALADSYVELVNVHMAVDENLQQQQVRFLHSLVLGPALKSYGVHVAKLAGLPASIIHRAEELMLSGGGAVGDSVMAVAVLQQEAMVLKSNQSLESPTKTSAPVYTAQQLSWFDTAATEAAAGRGGNDSAAGSGSNEDVFVALESKFKNIIHELKKFPIPEKTPLQALNQISQWQKKIKESGVDLV